MDVDFFANLMQYMPDAIYFKDRSSRFISISSSLASLYGLDDPALAVGKTDFDFFPEDQATEMMADERRVIVTGEPIVGKEEFESMADGSRRWYSTTKLPLRDGTGEIVGILGISREITGRKEAEQALREALLRLEDDMAMAREMQETFLPVSYPCFPAGAAPEDSRIRFDHLYLPSGEVGGDFFAVRQLSDTRAAICVFDVMGHGVRSALVTAIIHGLVTDRALGMEDPGSVLEHVNLRLFEALGRASSVVFTSAFCAVLDVEDGSLAYANAGHPSPILMRREAAEAVPLGTGPGHRGAALALYHDTSYAVSREHLAPGDCILLFTDGLFEAHSETGEMYGEARLREAAGALTDLPSPELPARLVKGAKAFAPSVVFTDDVCILCAERVT